MQVQHRGGHKMLAVGKWWGEAAQSCALREDSGQNTARHWLDWLATSGTSPAVPERALQCKICAVSSYVFGCEWWLHLFLMLPGKYCQLDAQMCPEPMAPAVSAAWSQPHGLSPGPLPLTSLLPLPTQQPEQYSQSLEMVTPLPW